ncbi:MAG: hypothetical protein ACXVEE_19295 [Polyangiales bacterium]
MAVDVPTIVVEDGAAKSLASLVASPDELRAAKAFREATGLSLVAPVDPQAVVHTVDPNRSARIARIESTLHAARGPLELGDRDALPSLRADLAFAYSEARAHPEDPEAPLLLAEVLRTMARAEDLAGESSGASALRARASLLDGGRKIGLSEGASTESAVARHPVAIAVEPLSAVVWIDGVRLKQTTIALGDGEHHLRIVDEQGVTLLARWIVIGASTTALSFRAGSVPPPCTQSELSAAARSTGDFSVNCASWAIVRRTKVSLEVRLCGATSCAQPTHWGFGMPSTPPTVVTEKSVFRSPWTWVAIGAAAVAGGTIAAWRLGAFDRPDAPPPTWRWEGAH